MRSFVKLSMCCVLSVLFFGIGASAAGLTVATGEDGITTLRVNGETPFHSTARTVASARLIELPGASTRVATWTETDAIGAMVPYYALGLDGAAVGEGRATSYVLELRHGRFDPIAQAPAIEDGLALGGDAELHIVQFVSQPLQAYRDVLEGLGGEVVGFLPRHAHIVRLQAAARARVAALDFVRWIGPYHPAYRLEEALRVGVPALEAQAPKQRYSVLLFDSSLDGKRTIAARIEAMGGAIDDRDAGKFRIEATLTPAQLYTLAGWDEIQFVDRWSPLEADMDIVREQSGANTIETVAGYTGVGVRGESFDAGFNINHPDFASRPLLEHGGAVGLDSHGTATIGVCFGDGTGDPRARGLLPDGQGIVADYNNIGLTGASRYTHAGELKQAPYFAVFQTSSVGSDRTFFYTTISADHDTMLFDWDVLHCQSQSNAGNQDSRPQAWAKNVVSGGAFNHYDTPSLDDDCWCSSGSIGPATDGRIKPDLSFFYDSTYTTYTTGSGYGEFGGTSGATPSICGTFGLFFQMWSDGIFGNEVDPAGTVFENRPHMTTAKAVMINTASQYPFVGTTHDMTRVHQGWGVPDLQSLYDLRDDISFIDESVLLGNTESVEFNTFVDPGSPALRVTMTYADPAGNPAAAIHRINDLTLKVTAPSGTVYWGNNGLLEGNWSVPGGAANTIDTVENVFVENPQEGLWIVEIIANEIVQDGHVETPELDADFALVVSGGFLTTCTSDGRVALAGAKYACDDDASVRVVDCDLNTNDETVETVSVTIDSDSESGGETVLLTESGPATSTFVGSIPVRTVDAPGTLLVGEGDTVTATYVDADDGMGGIDLVKTDTATVDCSPPAISNVQSIDVDPRNATITFGTDEPARGTVRYGLSCAGLTETANGSGFVTSHAVRLSGLVDDQTYFYAVDVVDEVGNAASDDNGGSCHSFTTPEVPDFFTELFTSDNDTDFLRLEFAPNGSVDGYAGCATTIASFPTDPTGGTTLSLTDDSSAQVDLTGGATVSLYGVTYSSFHVGSNGFITFTAGDSDTSESLADHFDLPRISALFDDLNPASAGTVSWKQLSDRVAVTWAGVTEYGTTNSNSFQIELFFNGPITINFLEIDAVDGLAGLSAGNGLSPDFFETDLSGMFSCGGVSCFDGIQNQGEERIDCGGPCSACDCLSDGACADVAFCNGDETCDGTGHCVAGTDPCPGATCDEIADVCAGCDDDGVCEFGEDCGNCPNDCASATNPVCGDGVCETADGEDCLTCPDDCSGVQNGTPGDRYCCGGGTAGQNPVGCSDPRCTALGKICEVDPVLVFCCGDGTCEGGETIVECARDCTPVVPGEAGNGSMLVVTGFDRSTGSLSISYGVACAGVDHTIEYGELTRAALESYAWSGQECGLGSSGSYDWNAGSAPTSMFFVVVGNNGTEEGSYGHDGRGAERPEDASSVECAYSQNLYHVCE